MIAEEEDHAISSAAEDEIEAGDFCERARHYLFWIRIRHFGA
jgi:hypothetical protein